MKIARLKQIIKEEYFNILSEAFDDPNIRKIAKYSTVEVMTGAIIQKPFDTIIPIEQIHFFS